MVGNRPLEVGDRVLFFDATTGADRSMWITQVLGRRMFRCAWTDSDGNAQEDDFEEAALRRAPQG